MKRITIAIDGYSACGKSTLAKDLAQRLAYSYLDTGAMYRAVARYAIDHGLWDEGTLDLKPLEGAMSEINISFDSETGHTILNGVDIEHSIRTHEVSQPASLVATYGFVREALVAQQQKIGAEGGIVMDGRDIGTVVFPKAELKIFLTATPKVRAQRRYEELLAKGDTTHTLEEVTQDLSTRDYRDTHRALGALRQAEDAVVIDNSSMNRQEQLEIAYQLAQERLSSIEQ